MSDIMNRRNRMRFNGFNRFGSKCEIQIGVNNVNICDELIKKKIGINSAK